MGSAEFAERLLSLKPATTPTSKFLAEINCQTANLRYWEKGHSPSISRVEKIAKKLNVDVCWLAFGSEEETSN